jgi:23S rRNA (uracil1939-C5)-methyltransferase
LRIERLNSYGVGVAYRDGVKHLVPGTLPGEDVEAVFRNERKGAVYADLIRVVVASPARVTPICPHYLACGGCDLQHVSYGEQQALKTGWVREWFKNGPKTRVDEIVPAPSPYGYRNRVMLHHDGKNFGFHRADSRRIEPVRSCAIATAAVNAKIAALEEKNVLKGPASFEIREGSGLGFVQVNAAQNENLVSRVIAALQLKKTWRVLELYAGAGNFTFALAGACRETMAVEGDADAVAAAGRMRKELKAKNVSFTHESVYDAVFRLVQEHETFDAVLCDPPREGLRAAAGLLPKLNPARIVYVSCEPRSLLKDAEALFSRGYALSRVVPVDMFPQTRHVELIAVFERTGDDLDLSRPLI